MTGMCRIEKLSKVLPKAQQGLDAPLIQFVRSVQNESGRLIFEDGDKFRLPRFTLPIPWDVARDMTAGLKLTTWWPDMAERTAQGLAAYDSSALVDQQEPLPETATGERALWVSVVVPLPIVLLSDASYSIVENILPQVEEACAWQVREFQVARQMRAD